jgi:hypothetical protein
MLARGGETHGMGPIRSESFDRKQEQGMCNKEMLPWVYNVIITDAPGFEELEYCSRIKKEH